MKSVKYEAIKLPKDVAEKEFVEKFSLLVNYSRLRENFEIAKNGDLPRELERFIFDVVKTLKDIFFENNKQYGEQNVRVKFEWLDDGYYGNFMWGTDYVSLETALMDNLLESEDSMCYIMDTLFHECSHYLQDKASQSYNIQNANESFDETSLEEIEDRFYGGFFEYFDLVVPFVEVD